MMVIIGMMIVGRRSFRDGMTIVGDIAENELWMNFTTVPKYEA